MSQLKLTNFKFQILSTNGAKKEALIQPFPLDELYFHDNEREFSM